MAEISIAILGLGRVGTSIGLALKRYNSSKDAAHTFKITGFTNIAAQAKTAQKLDALHNITSTAIDAVRNADIVMIAMPYAEVEATYQYIGRDVRAGAVVMDLSSLKQPSLQWAQKHLNKDAHMLGLTPIVNVAYLFDNVDETERATADLFDKGVMLVIPSVNCIPEAIDLGSDLAQILGANAQFFDVEENDSLIAATDHLPALLGLAYYHTLQQSQGWGDMQRLTNPAFGALTHTLFDTHPDDLRDEWRQSRAVLVQQLDGLMRTLKSLRQALAEDDRDTLEAVTGAASSSYEEWYNRRRKNQWEREMAKPSDRPDLMSSLFGSFIGGRLRRGQDKKD